MIDGPVRQAIDTVLFRPVGVHELALIWDTGVREFPPRLPHQPVFYPVVNVEYARQIARDWNTKGAKSGFAGYVTSFRVDSEYLSSFEVHIVGSSEHAEYWIPAESLASFNDAIRGGINVVEGFFGAGFKGQAPERSSWVGLDAVDQFLALSKMQKEDSVNKKRQLSDNRKGIFLNRLFWAQHDFSYLGIDDARRNGLLEDIQTLLGSGN